MFGLSVYLYFTETYFNSKLKTVFWLIKIDKNLSKQHITNYAQFGFKRAETFKKLILTGAFYEKCLK